MMRKTATGQYLTNLLDEARQQKRAAYASTPREVKAFRRRVKAKELYEVRKLYFVHASIWDALDRDEQERWIIRAVASHNSDLVFCAYSAAVMHGLPVSYHLLGPLHIQMDDATHSRSSDKTIRHIRTSAETTDIDGVRVTPLIQTVIDCLLIAPFADGLALADALLSTLGCDRLLLQEIILESAARRHGVMRAMRIASYADSRSESGGESIARGVMIENGTLPADIQLELKDPVDGEKTIRSDFLFKLQNGSEVLGELDGKLKYLDERYMKGSTLEEVLLNERQRESRLTMLGYSIVRFTMKDVRKKGRLAHLLATAGVVPGSLVQGDYRDFGPSKPDDDGCPTMRQAKLRRKIDRMIRHGLTCDQREQQDAA